MNISMDMQVGRLARNFAVSNMWMVGWHTSEAWYTLIIFLQKQEKFIHSPLFTSVCLQLPWLNLHTGCWCVVVTAREMSVLSQLLCLLVDFSVSTCHNRLRFICICWLSELLDFWKSCSLKWLISMGCFYKRNRPKSVLTSVVPSSSRVCRYVCDSTLTIIWTQPCFVGNSPQKGVRSLRDIHLDKVTLVLS